MTTDLGYWSPAFELGLGLELILWLSLFPGLWTKIKITPLALLGLQLADCRSWSCSASIISSKFFIINLFLCIYVSIIYLSVYLYLSSIIYLCIYLSIFHLSIFLPAYLLPPSLSISIISISICTSVSISISISMSYWLCFSRKP